jgi:hypothetical protein
MNWTFNGFMNRLRVLVFILCLAEAFAFLSVPVPLVSSRYCRANPKRLDFKTEKKQVKQSKLGPAKLLALSGNMEDTLKSLVSSIKSKLDSEQPSHAASSGVRKQYWISVAGAPGSGKSTLCKELSSRLTSQGIPTCVIPMDGFHYYRRELDQMPNAEEAHAKRGSHWTFNAARLVQVVSPPVLKGLIFKSRPAAAHVPNFICAD